MLVGGRERVIIKPKRSLWNRFKCLMGACEKANLRFSRWIECDYKKNHPPIRLSEFIRECKYCHGTERFYQEENNP